LQQGACAERSADHASMEPMQQTMRGARQNALGKSALGIQGAAIHRIMCRARSSANRLANKTDLRTIIG